MTEHVGPIGSGHGPLNPWSHPRDWKCYAIRYLGRTSGFEWTFSEACKLMRAIPIRHSVEIINPDGTVNFHLPGRKPSDDDANAGDLKPRRAVIDEPEI